MTILSIHEAHAPNDPFSNKVLIENDNSEPPRAPNGPFPNNVLVENQHSELPRSVGSKWFIFKQRSYSK